MDCRVSALAGGRSGSRLITVARLRTRAAQKPGSDRERVVYRSTDRPQFRGEFYNVLNTPKFGLPVRSTLSAAFDRITSTYYTCTSRVDDTAPMVQFSRAAFSTVEARHRASTWSNPPRPRQSHSPPPLAWPG